MAAFGTDRVHDECPTYRTGMTMPNGNAALIQRFYEAFQRLDGDAMAACYAADATFTDPVFGTLHGSEATDMWRMLVSRAENFSLTFSDVTADGPAASARWIARYRFSQTGRPVVNHVSSRFVIHNGLIAEQVDSFDLFGWTRQALGLKGLLLGWTPFVQGKIRAQARKGLATFRQHA